MKFSFRGYDSEGFVRQETCKQIKLERVYLNVHL